MSSPFDLSTLYAATEAAPPPADPIFLDATDGIKLAVRVYMPPKKESCPTTPPRASLIFYHGGGAHSGAGYQLLAQQLALVHGIQVYQPDLRGHGKSEGERGDSPSAEQVYRDIDTVVSHVRKEQHPDDNVPLFLGGHSSGAGLVMQYTTVHDRSIIDRHKLAGFLLLSPQLGPNACVSTDGSSASAFCKVSILPFIFNGIFGCMGHNPAVKFQYSEKELSGGNVPFNTVNMANAISPTAPAMQLKEMEAYYKLPMKLWMGEHDELFDAKKVQALYPPTSIVSNEVHIGILTHAEKILGPWLDEQLSS